jgi:hypothetical protein
MPTASPGALTGGAALQKEHQDSDLAKLVRMVGKRPVALSGLKKFLPKANKEQLQKVYDHLKLLRLRKHEADATEAFAQLKK